MYLSTGVGLLRSARMPMSAPLPDPPNTAGVMPWVTWLAGVWQVPVLADAVHAASPDLTRAVRALLAEDEPSAPQVQKVSTAVLHYLLRARYRATPFGLFAGTAAVGVGEQWTLPEPAPENITARPDALWLDAVLDLLHANPDIVEHLAVVADPTCQLGADQVVVPYTPGLVHPDQIRAPATAPLRDLLGLAARPVPVTRAADQLLDSYPGIPRPRALSMIAIAIRSGLLHSDLRPSSLDGFPLHRIRAFLDRTGVAAQDSTVVALKRIDDLLSAPDAPANEAAACRAYGARLMNDVADTGRPPLMIDVHCPDPVIVPRRLVQDVADALDVMTRLSTHPQGSPGWRDYRARFFDRYSLGVLVPVLELIDPIAGLGYPAGFRGSPWPRRQPVLTERDTYLLARIQQLMLDGDTELSLHQGDLDALQCPAPEQIWPSAEVTVAVHATSPNALDRGDYDLIIEGLSSTAGALTGRFLPLLSGAERQRAQTMHRVAPTLDDEAIRVQVCSPPLRRRAYNVARSIQLVPEVLALGEYAEGASMWVDEIGVGATAERLYLVHLPTMRRIEPFLPNAIDPAAATHPLARFLAELPRSHTPILTPFDWGAAADLPYLPRVRSGRVVLSPAQWQVTAADLGTATDLGTTTDAAEIMHRWRRRLRVPATVFAGDTDRRLRLDLDQPTHRKLLRQMTSQQSTLRVQEAPADDAYGWLGRAGQLTLSFTASQPQAPAPAHAVGPVRLDAATTRWPGLATTVLLRIDTDTDRTSDVFAAGLRELLDNCAHIRRWWFTRYRDPRAHLRIRIGLHQPDQFGELAARIATWALQAHRARLVADVSWHTDRPETGRYGTGAVLDAAEAYFAADSRAALAQDTPGRPPAEREGLLVASLLDISRHLLDDHLRVWDAAATRDFRPRFDPDARAVALRLGADAGEPDLDGIAGAAAVASTWQARATALDDYATALRSTGSATPLVLPALMHMHHVRAFGVDSDHEERALRWVREIAHSILVRRKVSA